MLFHTFRRVMLFLLPETEIRDSDAGPWANNDYNGQRGDDWSASPENHFPSASIRDFTPVNGSSNPYATAFQGF